MDKILRIEELKFVPRIGHIIDLELLAKRLEAKHGRQNKTEDKSD